MSATRLDGDVTPELREAVVAAAKELAALSLRIPRLHVVVDFPDGPSGVRLEIDAAEQQGNEPARVVRVEPGSHRVVATTSRRERAATTVVVHEGETAEVPLSLVLSPRAFHPGPLRPLGFALLGIGSASLPLAGAFALVGGLQNFCIRFGTSTCSHEGDTLLSAAVAFGIHGLVMIVTGVAFVASTARPRNMQIPDSEIFGAELRVPVWDSARTVPPSAATTVTLLEGAF